MAPRARLQAVLAYPVPVRVIGLLFVAVAAGAVASGGATASERATASLRLDGATLRPELALTPEQRERGLMFRRAAPRDGMLFVFPRATTGGFWMKNTRVPLKIVFFDTRGRAVRTLRMTPCRTDVCRLYMPRRQYRFALELPAADRRPAKRLGPPAALGRLIRASS